MHITLHEWDRRTRQRQPLCDVDAEPARPLREGPLTISESSELVVRLFPADPHRFQARIMAGNVLIASTRSRDRPEFPLHLSDEPGPGGEEFLICRGQLLRDWVGFTDLTIEVETIDQWRPILTLALRVTAGKMQQEAFEALFAELADLSTALLLDVYGKTLVGLEAEQRPGEAGPLAGLQRLQTALAQVTSALHHIARQPAYRLRTTKVREPVLAAQAVSELTLEEACTDPNLIVRRGERISFREQVREIALPHFDLAEHHWIAGFLRFLDLQIHELRQRILQEMDLREERRDFRSHREEPGARTWWEQEDLPRIEELRGLLTQLRAMQQQLAGLRRHSFLPAGQILREMPPATPLFRSNRAYAAAYRVIAGYFRSFRASLDNTRLLARAKSLPVLYEWWCALQVIRVLQSCLLLRRDDQRTDSPFRRLAEDRTRFLIDLPPASFLDFEDGRGGVVRLRYQPRYDAGASSMAAGYGLLGQGLERTPDLALEIFRSVTGSQDIPDLIVVLDAKYTSAPQSEKLDEVRQKYAKIGVFRTGWVLSRQVWALTPSPGSAWSPVLPSWAKYCTVDNRGFWSEHFDMNSTVSGAVEVKPLLPVRPAPLESLLRLLLVRCGIYLPE